MLSVLLLPGRLIAPANEDDITETAAVVDNKKRFVRRRVVTKNPRDMPHRLVGTGGVPRKTGDYKNDVVGHDKKVPQTDDGDDEDDVDDNKVAKDDWITGQGRLTSDRIVVVGKDSMEVCPVMTHD